MSNKRFRSSYFQFLFYSRKGCILTDFVNIEKYGDLISNKEEPMEPCNDNYININVPCKHKQR